MTYSFVTASGWLMRSNPLWYLIRVSGLFVLVLVHSNTAVAQGEPYEGFWVTSNFNSVVEITRCEQSLCAELVWLWAESVAGRQMLDTSNPNESKQKQRMVGLQLFSRFKADGDSWKGRIYNPEDGRNYRASVKMVNANFLRLKGCWGPFCRSQSWRRLSSVALPSESDLKRRSR